MKDARKKIFLVDDHPIFMKGLSRLIDEEPDLEVCGEAEDVFEATRNISKNMPDLVIVDLTLKDTSGFELIKHIHDHMPSMPVLVLSMHDETIYAERALKSGARGYIMKQEMSGRVVDAIRHVLAGKIFVSEKMNEKILGKMLVSDPEPDNSPVRVLSDRELEIFHMIGRGFKRKEIAEKLNLNVNTIGSYRERIKEKLDLASSAELVRHALIWVERADEGPSE